MKKHHYLLIMWLVISAYGMIMAFSANYINKVIADANVYTTVIESIIMMLFFGIAGGILLFKSKYDWYSLMKRLAVPIMWIAIACLVFVLLFGQERNNAKMVINLVVFDFQPMELFKLGIILYFAKVFSDVHPNDTMVDIIKKCIIIVVGGLLVVLQPDLGGALICLGITFLLLMYNGQKVKEILMITGGLLLFLVAGASMFLQTYQLQRFQSWINPFTDVANSGWQLVNSFVAISNGGLLGSGFMNSVQKGGYLFAPGSDFIFAVICEELGIIGAVVTIGLEVALAAIVFSIGNKAHERFGMLYCYGFASLILVQTFVNVGGVTGVIPMTGVTLPYISTGINSYAFLTLGLFLTIPISQARYERDKREKKTPDFKK